MPFTITIKETFFLISQSHCNLLKKSLQFVLATHKIVLFRFLGQLIYYYIFILLANYYLHQCYIRNVLTEMTKVQPCSDTNVDERNTGGTILKRTPASFTILFVHRSLTYLFHHWYNMSGCWIMNPHHCVLYVFICSTRRIFSLNPWYAS
jgi:hypothetical protein